MSHNAKSADKSCTQTNRTQVPFNHVREEHKIKNLVNKLDQRLIRDQAQGYLESTIFHENQDMGPLPCPEVKQRPRLLAK